MACILCDSVVHLVVGVGWWVYCLGFSLVAEMNGPWHNCND